MNTEKILQKQVLNNLLYNIGISQIEVKDELNEMEFRKWFANIGGNIHYSEEDITKGWNNHLLGDKRVKINYKK